jgi:hypothetical protein
MTLSSVPSNRLLYFILDAYPFSMRKYGSYFWMQNRVAVRLIGKIHERIRDPYEEGMKVMDEDWDNLIVLDAARSDLFEETIDLDTFDDYTTVTSLGSTSGQWVSRNFTEQTFGDTICITANPHTSTEAPEQFFKLIEVGRQPITHADSDEEIIGFHPEAVCDAARAAHEQHPDKRLIVHLMQPHLPFIATPELVHRRYRGEAPSHGFSGEGPIHIFEALANGHIDRQTFWQGYKKNLEFGFEYTRELAADLGGKTVFTADHGNMVGERTWPIPIRLYGHPRGVRTSETVEVPWAELTVGERRDWVDEGSGSESQLESDEIDDRLRALGYKD